MILVDYVLFVLVCPTILILHAKYFQSKVHLERPAQEEGGRSQPPPAELGYLEKQFKQTVAPLVIKHRHLILILVGVSTAAASFMAVQFPVASQPPSILSKSSLLNRNSPSNNYNDWASTFSLQEDPDRDEVHIIWGVDASNTAQTLHYSPKCKHHYSACDQLIYNPIDHLLTPAYQQWLLSSITALAKQEFIVKDSVESPMHSFNDWVRGLPTQHSCCNRTIPQPRHAHVFFHF